jgi:undecaprenyl-diphosphatase
MTLLDKVIQTISTSNFGYFIVFLASFLEASPLFGIFIPGQTVVMVAGFIAQLGLIDLWYVLAFATLGAILGDLMGYYLGRKYGYSFITSYGKYFLFKKEYFDKTKKLLNHHAGKTLFIGRFTSLTRAFAPFVAGASKIRFAKFLFFDIVGGIAWAIVFVMIGYIFGEGFRIAARYVGMIILIAIIISIVVIFGYRMLNKRLQVFAKHHMYALVINIISLYILAKMMEDLLSGEFLTSMDAWVSTNVVSLWTPALNRFMITFTNIASVPTFIVLSCLLLAYLVYKKRFYLPVLMVLSFAGGTLFFYLIKLLIHRARPDNALIAVSGYSFPSGHATIAIIFFSFLLYSFKDDIRNPVLRSVFMLGNILLFILIGFSRIYLDVHWFSDVVAGFALGLFWLTLLMLVGKAIIALKKDHFKGFKKRFEGNLPW